jgi:MtN3 and saliva related transmembrane protein
MMTVSLIGAAAAICTTGAYIPQAVKTWRTRSAVDISSQMFAIMALGTALWLAYGILKIDWAIIAANAVSLALTIAILLLKLRHG